mmetsp:Transcript_29547/g.47363  ORF Transcript_29547/g.47363 Transcript_29547/m.47363 type:complete len:130 (+) Transcript_29547:2599-2988(+)
MFYHLSKGVWDLVVSYMYDAECAADEITIEPDVGTVLRRMDVRFQNTQQQHRPFRWETLPPLSNDNRGEEGGEDGDVKAHNRGPHCSPDSSTSDFSSSRYSNGAREAATTDFTSWDSTVREEEDTSFKW